MKLGGGSWLIVTMEDCPHLSLWLSRRKAWKVDIGNDLSFLEGKKNISLHRSSTKQAFCCYLEGVYEIDFVVVTMCKWGTRLSF